MAEASPLLRLERLSKSFGALTVTDDLSLDFAPGELHAIIGPNGAGKTTLMHQVSGLLMPDGGRILFGGEDITGLSTSARVHRGIARTFQITSILPGFSALENVALAVQARSGSSYRFFGVAANEAALNDEAARWLDMLGLKGRMTVRAGSLSHGERRALEIAIALATRPKLLLLDEPLAGMGHDESLRVIDILRELKRAYTIILIEHDMDAVFALADRITVLSYGRIIASDDPEAIRNAPQVRAAYLGEDAA